MSIMIIVDAKLKDDKVEDAKKLFAELLPDTRGFEGCEGITMILNQEDPANMVLVEKWASKSHYEKYHHWREETGSLNRIRELLDGPPKRRFFEIVNE
ncbi:MAG: putative quinol monooxygenase [Thermodesulfobacteriota bacterium]